MRRLVRTVRTTSVVVVSGNEGVNLDYYPSAGRGPWHYLISPLTDIHQGDLQASEPEPSRDGWKSRRRKPNVSHMSGFFRVAWTVASGTERKVTLHVRNQSKAKIMLPVGTAIAECVVLPDQATVEEEFPSGLQHLVDSAEVDTEEQREKLRSLLCEYRDVFSLNGEIGCTDVIEHGIPTGDAAPVKHPLRRLPIFA